MGSIGRGESVASMMRSAKDISRSIEMDDLRRRMGQSGYEAGDPDARSMDKLYVRSGKAFIINSYLRYDEDWEKAKDADRGWAGLVSERWVKDAITKIDAGMKPLPESISLTRFVDGDALGTILPGMGISARSVDTLISKLESGEISSKDFSTVLRNADAPSKSYLSCTTIPRHDAFDTRAVKLNIVARPGTPAIITKNTDEHEVVLGRGLKLHFTGKHSVTTDKFGDKQLVLDVYV